MPAQWIYWTTENPGKWQLIPDTESARKQAIKQGAMFFTWASLSEAYKDNGQPEPHRHGGFPLDFDHKENPEKALQDLRTLCLVHLPELFGIDPHTIQFYASGSKGFHAVIPDKLFDAQDGDSYLPLNFKRIAAEWKQKLELQTLDLSLYNMRRGKMFRIANVKRSNGRYKVPLTLEEVRDLPIERLTELTRTPREIAVVEFDLCESEELGGLYRSIRGTVHQELKDRPEPVKLTEDERQRLAKDLPPCISHILTTMPPKSTVVNFNRLAMLLVNYFQIAGWDKQAVWAKVQPFIEQYPYSETYDTPDERLAHWKTQWNYLEGNSAYSFNCAFVKSLKLPGNAFDCSQCIGKTKADSLSWEFDDLTDWQTVEPPSLEWAFDGLIPKRIVGAIFARGGTGKTYFIEAMILGTITGKKVFRLFDPVTPKRVLALLSEDPPEVTRSRFYWIGETFISHDLSRQDLQAAFNDNLKLLCTKAAPLMQFDGKGNPERSTAFDWLKGKVEAFRPHVIFIDPKSQFYGLEEQSNDHNTTWVNTLKELTLNGATVIFAHHVPKKVDAFSVDALRGGGALGDACRWAMGMQGLDEIQAKELDIEDPWNYVHCRITKNSYAPLDGADFFFKRGARGELQRVEPRISWLESVAGRISEVLRDHYNAGGKDLTQKTFAREKDLRNLVTIDHPKATVKMIEKAIERGINQGLLSEIETIEKSRSHRVIRYLRPGGCLI